MPFNHNCLCFRSRGVFIFSLWFFFCNYRAWTEAVLYFGINKMLFNLKKLVACELDADFGFYNDILILKASPPFLDSMRGKNISGFTLVSVSFYPSFFPLSSLILEPTPVYFQNNLSIYFSFRYGPCFFCCYLFILNFP